MTKRVVGQFVTQLTVNGCLVTDSDPHDGRPMVRQTFLGHQANHCLAVMPKGLERHWAERLEQRASSRLPDTLHEATASPAPTHARRERSEIKYGPMAFLAAGIESDRNRVISIEGLCVDHVSHLRCHRSAR